MNISHLTVVLKAALAGKTIVLNQRGFVDGVFRFAGSADECNGLATYFSNSYNCDVMLGSVPHKLEETEPEPDVDDGEVPEPSERTTVLWEAIQAVPQDMWVEDVTPHPTVAAIVGATGLVDVTVDEIVEIVEAWMEDAPAEEDEEVIVDEDAPEEVD